MSLWYAVASQAQLMVLTGLADRWLRAEYS